MLSGSDRSRQGLAKQYNVTPRHAALRLNRGRRVRSFRLLEPGVAEVVDADKPRPGAREVLVRVAAASLCHTDVVLVSGPANLGLHDIPLPMTIGHEFAGWVEEVGAAVTEWTVGDAVAPYIQIGCGKCDSCQRGEDNICARGFRGAGVHSDGGAA